ncbi:hypothetical protein CVW53_24530 [Salmonella enterica]|nr:hypothetical protein [Salmonella enterica]ECU0053635.1 hypothetical protein [Salmonella enterica]
MSALLHYVSDMHRKMLLATLWNTGARTVSLTFRGNMNSEELRRQHREKLSPEGQEVCETLGVDPSRLAEINHNKKG